MANPWDVARTLLPLPHHSHCLVAHSAPFSTHVEFSSAFDRAGPVWLQHVPQRHVPEDMATTHPAGLPPGCLMLHNLALQQSPPKTSLVKNEYGC